MQPAHDPRPAALDRAAVRAEMESARRDFHRLIDEASPADLRQRSDGTKWTNQQLLFHMLFGYLVVRALLSSSASSACSPTGPAKRSRNCWTPRTGRST